MTDDELKARLRGLRVPPTDATARDRALHRAVIALKNARLYPLSAQRERRHPGLRWATAAGLIVFAAVLIINRLPQTLSPLAPEILLAEMNALFPGQVNAVIQENGEVSLELAEAPAPASDQPVLVEFEREGKVLRVLSYSGRRVCLDLGGESICFEPLVTAGGEVILSGEGFLWSSQHPSPEAGYQIRTQFLHPAS